MICCQYRSTRSRSYLKLYVRLVQSFETAIDCHGFVCRLKDEQRRRLTPRLDCPSCSCRPTREETEPWPSYHSSKKISISKVWVSMQTHGGPTASHRAFRRISFASSLQITADHIALFNLAESLTHHHISFLSPLSQPPPTPPSTTPLVPPLSPTLTSVPVPLLPFATSSIWSSSLASTNLL